tara:strand:- start:463 stop:777 length:315 start_codon:yes stop_codon:yes gene_type:complete
MEKIFPIIIIIVAIIGFSSSAYFFNQTDITIENPISMEIENNNSAIQEIESCIEQNLAGESSIALNSFNMNILLTLKQSASEAQSNDELEQIKQKLYRLTNCAP